MQAQGKAPDFVLAIASVSTGSEDTGPKREDYAALGILEYWRFDPTGEHHGTKLAGDRLVDGVYQPIPIDELNDGVLQGYSAVLNLNLRWEQGMLAWHDTTTGEHIPPLKANVAGPTRHVRPVSPPKPSSAPCARPASLPKKAPHQPKPASTNWRRNSADGTPNCYKDASP